MTMPTHCPVTSASRKVDALLPFAPVPFYQVVSKFAHMAGPLEYWQLDIDEKARGLDKTIVCDVDDCPGIADCEFDVTFSHTVLEQ